MFLEEAAVAAVGEKAGIRSFEFAAWVAGIVVLNYFRHSSSLRFRHQRRWMGVLEVGRRQTAAGDIAGLRLGVGVVVMRDVGTSR